MNPDLVATAELLGNAVDATVGASVLAAAARDQGDERANDVLDVAAGIIATAKDFRDTTGYDVPVSWASILPPENVPPGLNGIGLDVLKLARSFAIEKAGQIAEKLGYRSVESAAEKEAAALVLDVAAKAGAEAAAKAAAEKGLAWSAGKVFAVTVGSVSLAAVAAYLGPTLTEQVLQATTASQLFGDALKACAAQGTSPEKCDKLFSLAHEAQAATSSSISKAGLFSGLTNLPTAVLVGGAAALALILSRK